MGQFLQDGENCCLILHTVYNFAHSEYISHINKHVNLSSRMLVYAKLYNTHAIPNQTIPREAEAPKSHLFHLFNVFPSFQLVQPVSPFLLHPGKRLQAENLDWPHLCENSQVIFLPVADICRKICPNMNLNSQEWVIPPFRPHLFQRCTFRTCEADFLVTRIQTKISCSDNLVP